MNEQKRLTLQEYIQCYNIKKQIQYRFREESKKKSPDPTNSEIDHNLTEKSLSFTKSKPRINLQEQTNKSINQNMDLRTVDLYFQLQSYIEKIKFQCRSIIKNDKDFAFLLRMLDDLKNKFQHAVKMIHRQNILFYQFCEQNKPNSKKELNFSQLDRSFSSQWLSTKKQNQSQNSLLQNKTIKQYFQQRKKDQKIVKAILGLEDQSQTIPTPYFLSKKQNNSQNEAEDGKQKALSFLGKIMNDLANAKNHKMTRSFNNPQNQNTSQKQKLQSQPNQQHQQRTNFNHQQNQKINMRSAPTLGFQTKNISITDSSNPHNKKKTTDFSYSTSNLSEAWNDSFQGDFSKKNVAPTSYQNQNVQSSKINSYVNQTNPRQAKFNKSAVSPRDERQAVTWAEKGNDTPKVNGVVKMNGAQKMNGVVKMNGTQKMNGHQVLLKRISSKQTFEQIEPIQQQQEQTFAFKKSSERSNTGISFKTSRGFQVIKRK